MIMPSAERKKAEISDSPKGSFLRRVTETLEQANRKADLFKERLSSGSGSSAVLCLLSERLRGSGPEKQICFLFNKRSRWVRQAGDLCFPGGGISHRVDSLWAKLLRLPFFPLGRWPYWRDWEKNRPRESRRLALLLATALREGVEEMRLNPLRIRFLGPMLPQSLLSFQRFLYPMAAWIGRQRRFLPNREVEKVVAVPLEDLLNPEKYVCFRMRFAAYLNGGEAIQDFPGFLHEEEEGFEVLWGVTYRIVMDFLEVLFNFRPPAMEGLRVVEGTRDENYLGSPSGKRG